MIKFYAQDGSYFDVTSDDINSAFRVLNENVVSFNLKEEMRRMNSGSITLHDPNQIYSKVLRAGVKLDIEWGYNQPPIGFRTLSGKINALNDEIFGISSRSNFVGIIQHPSGGLSQQGQTTYNVNFFGSEYLSQKKYIIHRLNTRYDVIKTAMSNLGILPVNQFIDFSTATQTLNVNTQIIQRESDFRFLIRLSYEWRVAFRLGYNKSGQPTAVFVDYNKIGNKIYSKVLGHALGGSNIQLEYNKPDANVLSASWKQNAGTQGGGDNVRIIIGADGKPQFFRFVSQGETVKVYKLVPERIGKELQRAGNFTDRTALLTDWLKTTDFEKIEKYFDEVDQSTAPQGYGYEINVEMVGNPMVTAPIRAEFGSGFPTILQRQNQATSPNIYYMNSIEHKIDINGYFMSATVMDALSVTGGSFI